jgi:hypothetical protein
MDKPQDQGQDKNSGDKAEAAQTSATPTDGAAAHGDSDAASNLPMVESPGLGSGEVIDEPAHDHAKFVGALPALFSVSASEAPHDSQVEASGQQQRHFRFAVLAATIACAAAVGALAGSLTASGIGHQNVALAAIPQSAAAHDNAGALRAQRAEMSSLKASLDGANRGANAQLAKITDRLNNLEHAQADTSAKLAHIAETVDRLEKQTADAEVTGSIKPPAPAAAPVAAARLAGPVLHDWAVQDVRGGRAMVESRYGAYFLVGEGSVMPGLGRVEQVKRQNGQWIVVTAKGLITQHP